MDIRNCRIKYQCPKTWNSLDDSIVDDIKYCDECKQNVHYCTDEQALMKAMQNDWCVAIPIQLKEEDDQLFLGDNFKLNQISEDDILMGDIDYDPFSKQ